VRELFPTTPECSTNRLATEKGGACVRLGASRGMPANLVPRTVGSVPSPRTFGNHLDVVFAGQPTVCLGLPCKV
jgi:hypothetical protein